MVLGVILYTICGALIIQSIEKSSNNTESNIRKRTQEIGKQERTTLTSADRDKGIPISVSQQVGDCILNMLVQIAGTKNCSMDDIDAPELLDELKQCYKNGKTERHQWRRELSKVDTGYGHVAPSTLGGRIFCIIYGLIGIPFTLLTIANLGMFLSKSTTITDKNNTDGKTTGRSDRFSIEYGGEESERGICDCVFLGITFLTYLMLGSYALSLYEPDMDFFKAVYFNFITLTTIGLGDFVPKSDKYLLVTLLYTTVGLALTTIAMEIIANVLKKIHYFGRQIENVSHITVWFGGQKMTVKKLVQRFGDQMNIPVDELANLNLDTLVKSAIKVEAGEMMTLRKSKIMMRRGSYSHALHYSDIRKSGDSENLMYIDEKRNSSVCGNIPPVVAAETGLTSLSYDERFSKNVSEIISTIDCCDEFILDISQLNKVSFRNWC
uniref:Potassium channel domain-containing protein n=1 Tax=Setaria digitata TaxID=48799 RepID=A0A915Q6V1_9BILA